MADIGEPLRRVKIIPLKEPVRGPEPERQVPAPQMPQREPEKADG